MYHKEREQQILNQLKKREGFVTVKELCEALFTSESSIRRDLVSLEKAGLVKRSWGGAEILTHFSGIVTFDSRTRQNTAAKIAIAKKAAAKIQEGNVIFLDQSSSAFFVANEILDRSDITVVTNNIEILMLLSRSGNRLISSGGILSGENRNCLLGAEAKKCFDNIFADLMFFSVKGISSRGDLCDCSREEIAVREAMMHSAKHKVLLCDHSKFGLGAPFRQCDIGEVDEVITEKELPEDFLFLRDKTEYA